MQAEIQVMKVKKILSFDKAGRFFPALILIKYFLRKGRIINYKNPKLFSEKIQWLKVYDCLPIKTQLADKLAVRNWVMKKLQSYPRPLRPAKPVHMSDNIGSISPHPLEEKEELLNEYNEFCNSSKGSDNVLYLKKIYGIYEKYEDIDFSKLPDEYVIKTNHGCNMQLLVIEGAKPDDSDRETFNNYLKVNNAYKSGYEMHYRDIKPFIFTEEYIKNTNELFEYLIFCFNGEPKMILFASEKRTDNVCCTMFDTEWNNLHFNYGGSLHPFEVPKPKNLDKMLEIARILSKDFKFVRVDLHNVDGKIYFGEMTFTPASGYMKFNPRKYDRILGDMLVL